MAVSGAGSSRLDPGEGGASQAVRLHPKTDPNVAVLPRRALAWALDSGFVLAMWLFASDAVHGPFGLPLPEEVNEAGWAENLRTLAILCAVWPACGLAYYTLFEGLLGLTPGKLLFGLRVIREDTMGRPGMGRAFVRSLARLFDGVGFYLVGWAFAMSSRRRRRVGDLLAGTLVVGKGRAPSLGTRGRVVPQGSHGEEERALRARIESGRRAEKSVAEKLAPLADEGFYLFNNLYTGTVGDIDHLLVGPTGLFVVETKAHKGRVTVDSASGQLLKDGSPFEKDFLRQSERQAEDTSRKVLGARPGATPFYRFVCFARAQVAVGAGGTYPEGICPLKDLPRAVLSFERCLSVQEVDEIADRILRAYGKEPDVSRAIGTGG